MQAHAKNKSGDKESFYSFGLGGSISLSGFYLTSSINKALGKNQHYADDYKFLIKFGYKQA